jgi:hypothetical protein
MGGHAHIDKGCFCSLMQSVFFAFIRRGAGLEAVFFCGWRVFFLWRWDFARLPAGGPSGPAVSLYAIYANKTCIYYKRYMQFLLIKLAF